jgi:hypothetical protein
MPPKLKAIKNNSGFCKEDAFMKRFYPEYDQMCPDNLNRRDVDRVARDETLYLEPQPA